MNIIDIVAQQVFANKVETRQWGLDPTSDMRQTDRLCQWCEHWQKDLKGRTARISVFLLSSCSQSLYHYVRMVTVQTQLLDSYVVMSLVWTGLKNLNSSHKSHWYNSRWTIRFNQELFISWFVPFVNHSLGQRVLASRLAMAPNNKWRYFCLDALKFSRKNKWH